SSGPQLTRLPWAVCRARSLALCWAASASPLSWLCSSSGLGTGTRRRRRTRL
ncbi:hypothetical protein HK101_004272, partial [Irineochytrium annulatum]